MTYTITAQFNIVKHDITKEFPARQQTCIQVRGDASKTKVECIQEVPIYLSNEVDLMKTSLVAGEAPPEKVCL